ncbi:MAG: hypothetical protein RLZZ136_1446 [Pseudomonadota bacterium]
MRMDGRARDIFTPAQGVEIVRAEANMVATVAQNRTISAISADPAPAAIAELVGKRGGGHLRVAVREIMPELLLEGSPLYLLLDDISGTSLISPWAMSQWLPDWVERMRQRAAAAPPEMSAFSNRTDVCWGFRQESTALKSMDLAGPVHEDADAGDLRNPADPGGWHLFPESQGMAFRRARRIDVWRDADAIHIEASFQDSGSRPQGDRAALHEYIVRVAADPQSQVITSLEADPRVLPFWECPGAIAHAKKLIGTSLGAMREAVHDNLRGPIGCTHLNDALRGLADVPHMLELLDAEMGLFQS